MSETVPKNVLWAKLNSSIAFQELLTTIDKQIAREQVKFFDLEGNASEREKETQRLKVKHYREFVAKIRNIVSNSQQRKELK